ncbi:Os03g0171450 [Oryza sativa Japonica Group]|uniref:Os03g0171450 protein n=1 Tax=Oryza sativa subsp. japonica TaxID=39947 RepID=A0A0P0VTQ8_ORYSJ|nr:Os03g0171450 [Oryza sativa Japonica Group]
MKDLNGDSVLITWTDLFATTFFPSVFFLGDITLAGNVPAIAEATPGSQLQRCAASIRCRPHRSWSPIVDHIAASTSQRRPNF